MRFIIMSLWQSKLLSMKKNYNHKCYFFKNHYEGINCPLVTKREVAKNDASE